jgi:hypothetical protein
MTNHSSKPNRDAAAGKEAPDRRYRQYGRRVEADRSWTVYNVFTGVPADIGDGEMTGLSRIDATDRMMSLNRLNSRRLKERATLDAPPLDVTKPRRIIL